MDPDACLRRFHDACGANERDGAIDALHDLATWLARGGYFPRPPACSVPRPGGSHRYQIRSPAGGVYEIACGLEAAQRRATDIWPAAAFASEPDEACSLRLRLRVYRTAVELAAGVEPVAIIVPVP